MRILVHESVTEGSLVREGVAMRAALVTDLAAAGHQVVTSAGQIDSSAAMADAVWLIAPETGGCLERLTARMERKGHRLVGSSSAAIRRASDKAYLAELLRRHGIPHPETRVVRSGGDYLRVARDIGYPIVVKPARGAGCQGVCLARDPRELVKAVAMTRTTAGRQPVLLQRYVRGVHASVSLLADGRRARPLTVNRQSVRAAGSFVYTGGATPLDHPLAGRAIDRALRTCDAIPGLRGFVGVDIVLTPTDAVVIEVNPRLTTAYLGVRAALDRNVAAMAIEACDGRLPRSVRARRQVRFTPSGGITTA
jgi:hypothetical protein